VNADRSVANYSEFRIVHREGPARRRAHNPDLIRAVGYPGGRNVEPNSTVGVTRARAVASALLILRAGRIRGNLMLRTPMAAERAMLAAG
jgi:hypothetical protein